MDKFLKDVVPKRRVIRIAGEDFGTQETFGLAIDVKNQTKADIAAIIVGITLAEADQQEALDNPVTRQLIDGSATKPLLAVQRRSVLWFGNEFDMALIRAVEKNLRQAIKRFLPNRVTSSVKRYWGKWGWPEIADVQASWDWYYKSPTDVIRRISRSELKSLIMPPGAKLILRPKESSDIAVGYLNHIAKTWGLKSTARRGANKGVTRIDNTHGFMAHSIKTLKRSIWSRNYTIYISNTKRRQTMGDRRAKSENVWSHGTPYITIIARMRTNQRGTFRRYRKVSEYRR